MAKKVILKDHDNNEIMPITRGELVLDSSGNQAFHSDEFLATDTKSGLLSKEDKLNLIKLSTGVAYGNADTVDGKHASDFLPITGGEIISTNHTPLIINSLYPPGASQLQFKNSNQNKAVIGYDFKGAFIYNSLCSKYINITDSGICEAGGHEILSAGNYNSYSPKLDGTGAIGTWNININGDAKTLNNLQVDDFSRRTTFSFPSGTYIRISVAENRSYLITIQGPNSDRNALFFITGYDKGTILRNSIRVIKEGPYDVYINGDSEYGCFYICYNGKGGYSDTITIFPRVVSYSIVNSIPEDVIRISTSWDTILATKNHIPTKLSDLTDDVVSGKYLPLTGGTLKNTTRLLTLESNNTYSTIQFKTNNGYAHFGLNTQNNYLFVTPINSWDKEYIILHSENYTNYINSTNFPGLTGVRSVTINEDYLKVNTNGVETNLTIPYAKKSSYLTSSIPLNSNYTLNFYAAGAKIGTTAYNGSSNDYTLYSFPGISSTAVSNGVANIMNLRFQFHTSYFHDIFTSPNTRYLWHRNVFNSVAKSWSRIVEEDSDDVSTVWNTTVTKANTLTTPRTIWGQSFDGTSDIKGCLHITADNVGDYTQGIRINQISTIPISSLWLATTTASGYNNGMWGISATNTGNFRIRGGATSANDFLNITQNGNVLIGTTSNDGNKLQINGTVKIYGGSDNSGLLFGVGGNSIDGYYNNNYGNIYLNPSSTKNVYLVTGGGNVGIGTNVPAEKLEVNGNVKATTFKGNLDWSYIQNKPTSLPANGGNADTLGGYTADAIFRGSFFKNEIISTTQAGWVTIASVGQYVRSRMVFMIQSIGSSMVPRSTIVSIDFSWNTKDHIIKISNSYYITGVRICRIGDYNYVDIYCESQLTSSISLIVPMPYDSLANANTSATWYFGNLQLQYTPSDSIVYNTCMSVGRTTYSDSFAATSFLGNLDGTYINKLTGYTKATSASNIATTDSLNTALGKLEYKAGTTYDWYKSITQDDTDTIINKWGEIVDFIDSVTEGTDITDEFVTRKTEQTITGVKTFKENIIINKNSTADTSYTSGNAAITFMSGEQPVKLMYSHYDSYRPPAGLKVIGDQNNCWFEVDGTCYADSFVKSGGTSSQFLKADGSVDSNTYVTGGPYLPLAGGTMNANALITLPSSSAIIKQTTNSSNYVNSIAYYKGTSKDDNKYPAQLGWWNTGDDGNGLMILLPYSSNNSPWVSGEGLSIGKNILKWENKTIIHSENISSYALTSLPSHTHDYASIGSVIFTPANSELTPADVLAKTGNWSIKKGTWNYSGNGYIKAGDFGNIDLAGTSILTFGSSGIYTQLYITAPTQSGHSGKTNEIFFYNYHGPDYAPGWTRVLTNRNYTDYINTTNFPGLNKTGTVTSITVTGNNGLSGTGTITTSGTITLSNAGVRSTTINGNYLSVNTNGTNADLTIPYASVAGKLSIGKYDKSSDINFTKVFWTANGVDGDSITGFNYAAVMNVGSDLYRGWQIWNSCNIHTLYWRPAKTDASAWADVHALLDSHNYTSYTPILNSASTHATNSSVIYAPTTSGTSGQYLMSNGSGAPVWTSLPALASPYAIKFKNIYGTEVSYNGSVAIDLTSGINYATLASQLSSTRIFGFENKQSSYCKIATISISSRYNGRYGLLKCYTTLTTIPSADSFEIFVCAYQQDALGNPPVIKFKTTNTNNLYKVIGLLNYTSTSSTFDIYIYGYNRIYLSLNTSLISGNIVISPESYVSSLPSGTQITPTPMGNVEMLNGYLDSDFWKKTELTKVSQLTNDSGYLTSHQSLANYVTLNGEQTITGLKTFESASDTVGVSLKLKNKNWVDNMSTAMDFYNGRMYTVPNARIETKMVGSGKNGGTLIFYTQGAHASTNPNPNGLTERFRIGDDGTAKLTGRFTVTNSAWPQIICNSTSSDNQANIRFDTNSSNKGYVGYVTGQGTFLYNTAASKYLAINDKGQAHVSGTLLSLDGHTHTSITDGTMSLIAQYNNEINFGGSYNSGVIYFGCRTIDSKPIPTQFVFGNSTGTASITASGFKKNGSSDSYVLLGAGGHKAISDFLLKTEFANKELESNLTTITKTLTVTQDWMDTGIKHTDLPNDGTYIIQIYTSNSTNDLWYTYWSGIMSWFQQETNDNDSDEIILHRAGYAYGHTIYLRTIMTARSDGRNLRLQIAADTNLSTAATYTFKFKRII